MAQLHDIESSFAGFVLADEGLWDAESFGYLDLCETCLVTCLAEELAEALVFGRVDRLLHLASAP
ncbi:hypothetical protein BAY60_24915 [Prauserella muralis]|uniref:Uncharacterized protein n=1 Tax=Prauserella muralis TaxID=588067 RepID=A0A2V4ALC2_9PSEU|nr:hypothetical protein BAY60_24915 [Prauserella muralis]